MKFLKREKQCLRTFGFINVQRHIDLNENLINFTSSMNFVGTKLKLVESGEFGGFHLKSEFVRFFGVFW